MILRNKLKHYAPIPVSTHLMHEVLADYKRPNDKISELILSGALVSVRRGLYVFGDDLDLPNPEPFLIANHLRGPSYISSESALAYWGMIPERTFEVSSVTLKTSKKYHTPKGRFSYEHVDAPYYAFGIRSVKLTPNQQVMIASPEKAICDKIVLTSQLNLRSIKQTRAWLLEDMRFDLHELRALNCEAMESWLEDAPKRESIKMFIKTLREL